MSGSIFKGSLVRYIVRKGTPDSISIMAAARACGVRADTFRRALADPAQILRDALFLQIDVEGLRIWWRWAVEEGAEADVAASMLASAKAVARRNDCGACAHAGHQSC